MHYTLHLVSEINASFKTLWSSVFSCPFDRLTIYDGPDNLADKIGKVYPSPLPCFLYSPIFRDLLRPDEEPGGVQHPQPALRHLPHAQEDGAGLQPRILRDL